MITIILEEILTVIFIVVSNIENLVRESHRILFYYSYSPFYRPETDKKKKDEPFRKWYQ